MSAPPTFHGRHFSSLEHQNRAARLGMWVFLASELLLFAALFALYAAYRSSYPDVFREAIAHGDRTLGTLNTAVLLCSSYTVAMSIAMLRRGRRRASILLIGLTILFAFAFLGVKSVEYRHYFEGGVLPGRAGGDPLSGKTIYYTIYFAMTGIHAIHVLVGMGVLAWLAIRVYRGSVTPEVYHPLELGGMYWHLVDIIWIFLWPLFYLTGGD